MNTLLIISQLFQAKQMTAEEYLAKLKKILKVKNEQK